MARIRALMVDDDERLLDRTQARLDREIGWEIDWETATDVDEGRRLITSSARRSTCDRRPDVPPGGFPDLEPRGLDLVRDAQPPVLAHLHPGHQHRALSTCTISWIGPGNSALTMSCGASSSARNLRSTARPQSPPRSRTHLLDNGTVSRARSEPIPANRASKGCCIRSARPRSARLYAKILESGGHRAERIDLRFLTPRASGASVCAVTAYLAESAG